MSKLETYSVCSEVIVERSRQDKKWGEQNHDSGTWALILGEEFGEACEAALDVRYKNISDPAGSLVPLLRSELIQVAAVAIAWCEAIDREENREERLSHAD